MNTPTSGSTSTVRAPLPADTKAVTVNQLIDRYRAGDPSAAEELLARFDRYLQKWVRLFLYASWDPKDQELRHFLSMLGSVDLNQTAQILSRQLKAYEKEDIEQEVRVALLDCAMRRHSIRRQYRYILHHRIVPLIRDPVVFSGYPPLAPADVCDQKYTQIEVKHTWAPDIDQAWVEGLTCSPGFDQLSKQERHILQLTKWYGHSIEATSRMLGVSVATVNRAIAKARRVLRVYYLE